MNGPTEGFSREFFLVLVLILLTFFFFVHQVNQEGFDQIELDSRELERRNRILKERIAQAREEIALLETDQGIEMEARRKLRLIKPGEIIIKAFSTREVQLDQPVDSRTDRTEP